MHHESICGSLVFAAGAGEGLFILGLGGVGGRLRSLHLGFGFVALLERQYAFVIKFLHTVVSILGEVRGILGARSHCLEGRNVFGAGTILCLISLGASCTQSTLGLNLFRLDFGAANDSHDGILFDHVAFAEEQLFHAARDLPRHQHAASFHLALQIGIAGFRRKLLQRHDSKNDQGNQRQDH